MSYTNRLQRTIDYIEVNLKNDMELPELAEVACFSPFHFCRIFQLYTGKTIMEYVRIRRISSALMELKNTKKTILEIAIDYSFGSRDSFTRAFKRIYGINPGMCRKQKIYPVPESKMDLQEEEKQQRRKIMVNGLEMKIVEFPSLKIAGYELRTNQEKSFQEIPAFWQKLMKEEKLKTTPGLLHKAVEYEKVEIAFCTSFDPGTKNFSYIVGWIVKDFDNLPKGLATRENPAATFAVFTTPVTTRKSFTTVIQLATRYIYQDWLPKSEYEFDDQVSDLEWYDERCWGEENICMDICVPVRKK